MKRSLFILIFLLLSCEPLPENPEPVITEISETATPTPTTTKTTVPIFETATTVAMTPTMTDIHDIFKTATAQPTRQWLPYPTPTQEELLYEAFQVKSTWAGGQVIRNGPGASFARVGALSHFEPYDVIYWHNKKHCVRRGIYLWFMLGDGQWTVFEDSSGKLWLDGGDGFIPERICNE